MYVSLVNTSIKTVLIIYLFMFLTVLPACAKEAILRDIVVTKDDSHLLLYFSVADPFTKDMKEAIGNGVNITFNFFIRVHEVRKRWWDKKIADIKVTHDVRYDSLKEIYMVSLHEKDDKEILVRSIDEVEGLMSKIEKLKLTELQALQRGDSYQVRMMAKLDKTRLPNNLHNVLFFLSPWEFKTDWHAVDFTY